MNVSIPCVCPTLDGGVRHPDGDTVTLRDKLAFRAVEAIRQEVSIFALQEPEATTADSLAIFAEGYVLHGIESWTLQQDGPKGRAELIEVNRGNIRQLILDDLMVADAVSTAADALYAEAVLLPLLARASQSSPSTPTGKSTSASRPTGTRRPRRSRPSSITTIPTGDTETTSAPLDGVSNSSPNSASAA